MVWFGVCSVLNGFVIEFVFLLLNRLDLRKTKKEKKAVYNLLLSSCLQVVMEVDINAVGEQLRILQGQYKEKSKEYDRLYEKFNQTSQVTS